MSMFSASNILFGLKKTKKQTNAVSLPVIPIQFCCRQQSTLKSSIPCEKASVEVPRSLLCTSLELKNIFVFLFVETMSNRFGLVIKAWQTLRQTRSPEMIKHLRIELVIWNKFAHLWLLLFDVCLDILVSRLWPFFSWHSFAVASKNLVDFIYLLYVGCLECPWSNAP